jgi:putative transposase
VEEGRRREIALFRYSLVRSAADGVLSRAERGRLVRALAGTEHVGPDGERVRVSRSTIDRWVRHWRTGGYEALVPRPRIAELRTPTALLELAESLKRETPGRTAAQVHAIMLATGQPVVPAVRTLQRHFAREGLNMRADGRTPDRVYGRFEASQRNELWMGDGLHGPKVQGRTAILLAFIDDHSRLLVGYRWGFAEDVLRLEAALRAGLSARGVPAAILVDRGSAFVSHQLLRSCAVLGVRLIHASPRAATTKGKIERFFRTVRDQFLVELDGRELSDSTELNRLFGAWVESVYHRRCHSETKATPLERFMADGPPSLPGSELLREAFLWQESRTVTKTATVSLFGNRYEVDPALAGRRCELIFDPFDLTKIEVRYKDRPLGLAVPLQIGRHTHPQAKHEQPPASESTGIDYLALLAAQRERELSGRPIDYAALAGPQAGREVKEGAGEDDSAAGETEQEGSES